MILVLEGAEGTGKTTLANKLHKEWQYGSLIIHHSRGSSNPEYLAKELSVLHSIPKYDLVIMDRWWHSDYVYSALESRSSEMRIPLNIAERRYDKIVTLKVLLTADLSTRQVRAQADDAPVVKEAEGAMYTQLFGHWACNLSKEVIYESLMSHMPSA